MAVVILLPLLFSGCGRYSRQTSRESAPVATCSAVYDDLNRPTPVTPAAGQGAIFQYLKDPALKRLMSLTTVTGTGTWEWRGMSRGTVTGPYG